MPPIKGRQGITLEMKLAHQHRVFSVAMHDAAAAGLHGSVISIGLLHHLVMALVQADQIVLTDFASPGERTPW